MNDPIRFVPFDSRHVASAAEFASALDWPSYADPAAIGAAFSAPGAITWIALRGEQVVGLAHLLTNGVVHAHLSLVGVLPEYRRRGIAQRLIAEAFARCGAKWLDLSSEPGSEEFYRSFRHRESVGFRIYPPKPASR